MRMGINLLQFKEITSLAVYTQNILENFGKLDKEDNFLICESNRFTRTPFWFFPNFHYIKLSVNPKKKFLWPFFEQIISPLYLPRRNNIGL
jgi:hypothetical protein